MLPLYEKLGMDRGVVACAFPARNSTDNAHWGYAQFGRERTASSCGGIVWAARRIQGRPSARLWLFRENPRRALIGMLRGLAEATLANSLVPGRFGVSTLRRGSFSMSRAPRSNICTRASRPNQVLRRPMRPSSPITVSKPLTTRSSEKPRPRSALAPRQIAARDQLRLAPSHRPCATRS
jgi:hypothetical protein